MSAPWVWDELDIARSPDATAIRRAYARRLKATQPEDDSAAFQRLRSAYETALAYAAALKTDVLATSAHADARPAMDAALVARPEVAERQGSAGSPNEAMRETLTPEASAREDVLLELSALVRVGAEPASLRQALDSALSNPAMATIGVAMRTEIALAALIVAHAPQADSLLAPASAHFQWRDVAADGRPVAPEVAAALNRNEEILQADRMRRLEQALEDEDGDPTDIASATMAEIIGSPLLHNLVNLAQTEAWLAALILRYCPESDHLLEGAATCFGWTAARDDSPDIQALAHRRRVLQRLGELRGRKHIYHRAYKALLRGPSDFELLHKVLFISRAADVRNLLVFMRQEDPQLLRAMPAKSVEAWTAYLNRSTNMAGWVRILFYALMAASFLFRIAGHG